MNNNVFLLPLNVLDHSCLEMLVKMLLTSTIADTRALECFWHGVYKLIDNVPLTSTVICFPYPFLAKFLDARITWTRIDEFLRLVDADDEYIHALDELGVNARQCVHFCVNTDRDFLVVGQVDTKILVDTERKNLVSLQ